MLNCQKCLANEYKLPESYLGMPAAEVPTADSAGKSRLRNGFNLIWGYSHDGRVSIYTSTLWRQL